MSLNVDVVNSTSNATTNNAASKNASTAGEYLTLLLGSEEYGLEILKVQEIRGYDAVTQIANTMSSKRVSIV